MATRRAAIILILSLTLLAAAGAALLSSAGTRRSDLAGASVVRSSLPVVAPRIADDGSAGGSPSGPADNTPTTIAVPPPIAGIPQRLTIASLGVDAPVIGVGLEVDGSMEIPGATEAGWYRPGARPGAPRGSAVIAAHVDFNQRRGVFFDLRRLEVGAEVVVTGDDGTARPFVVTERFQVGKADLPVGELFRPDGEPVLTLITCGGAFDSGAGRYDDNIVVRAVPL